VKEEAKYEWSMSEEQLVRTLYQAMLRREPDPPGLARHVGDLKAGLPPGELVKNFVASPEFLASNSGATNYFPLDTAPPMVVDLQMSSGQAGSLWAHVAKSWAGLGSAEPYWSVLTDPRWKLGRMSGADSTNAFYETGQGELERMEKWLARNQVELPAAGTCVEYGCGVGRCTGWLARRFARVIAFDVSEPHLARARARMKAEGLHNVEFVHLTNKDGLQALRNFDFFYSIIVLQHNPPPLILWILERAFEQLRPGGIAFFQVPTYAAGYRFDLDNYLSQLKKPDMEMHFVPQHAIFELASRFGIRPLEVSPDHMVGHPGSWISSTFLLSKVAG
jgi:SAM-dependent methyltransferase